MRPNPIHASADPQFVQDLIVANPWATIASVNDGRPVASHYPILLDDSTDELAIVTHVGRPDEQIHAFGAAELLVSLPLKRALRDLEASVGAGSRCRRCWPGVGCR